VASGDLYNGFAGDLRTSMRGIAAIVRADLEHRTRQDAPHVSGRLRQAITMDPFREEFDRFVSTIRADTNAAPWAWYTNEGTGIYVGNDRIRPRPPARALAFFWLKIGQDVVFASVAGQPGQHWWEGPDGTAFDTRLDAACEAAWGR
jgi:hypothetical protein